MYKHHMETFIETLYLSNVIVGDWFISRGREFLLSPSGYQILSINNRFIDIPKNFVKRFLKDEEVFIQRPVGRPIVTGGIIDKTILLGRSD